MLHVTSPLNVKKNSLVATTTPSILAKRGKWPKVRLQQTKPSNLFRSYFAALQPHFSKGRWN